MRTLGNDPATIEAMAGELAAAAYHQAMTRERTDYFQRGSEPSGGGRKKNPALYRLTAGKAKEWAGKYALCQRLGTGLIAIGAVYDTLEQANAVWQEQKDTRLVVGCCNRLDRCWQLPRFNPLYAVFDPRPQPEARTCATETAREQEDSSGNDDTFRDDSDDNDDSSDDSDDNADSEEEMEP